MKKRKLKYTTYIRHGLTKHPLYKKWHDMRSRCYNIDDDSYSHYGGRGITVCNEWSNNFQTFYNWAIENGWKNKLQIDRYPNKNGNYEPANCRFVTCRQNQRNKNNNYIVHYQGQPYVIVDLIDKLNPNINYHTVYSRIFHRWDPIVAIITPIQKNQYA